MNLDALRPCDNCGGPINPSFFRVSIDQQVIDQDAVRERGSMLQFFRGSAALASVFDARGDRATSSIGVTNVILCTGCFCSSMHLAAAWEKRARAAEETTHGG